MAELTDKELLERAAKAAGIELWHEDVFANGLTEKVSDNGILCWNPLMDDGDEARLEGTLLMNVSWGMASVTVDSCTERYSDHYGDKQKARRYAGVRAAVSLAAEGGV